jgi:hypothetical protein
MVRMDIRLKTMPQTKITERSVAMLTNMLLDLSEGVSVDVDEADTLFVKKILKYNVEFIVERYF